MIEKFDWLETGFTSSDPIDEAAMVHLGLNYLYPLQKFVISNILEKKDQIVIMPTGSGKTICFTLPLFFLEKATLVVFPLLSLLEDQKRRLEEKKIKIGVYKGGQSPEKRIKLRQELINRETKIVLSTPEALIESHSEYWISNKQSLITHFVVDEAHCISEWGESFRPAYLKLGKWIDHISPEIISAFTATASSEIQQNIQNYLFQERTPYILQSNPDRPNIQYNVVRGLSKSKILNNILAKIVNPVLIFCRSRRKCENLSRYLRHKYKTDQIYFYHAGLFKKERQKIEEWFLNSNHGILVATTAYGMGVDKANIRNIIHFDLPLSIEAFLQESGRAGRDQKTANSFLIYTPEDLIFLDKIQQNQDKIRYQKILTYALTKNKCRREILSDFMNYEFEYCNGCDICSLKIDTNQDDVWGQRLPLQSLLAFLKKHNRRYSFREVRLILKGENNYASQEHPVWKDKYFGCLSEWDDSEITELLDNLILLSIIKVTNSFYSKGRICFSQYHKALAIKIEKMIEYFCT